MIYLGAMLKRIGDHPITKEQADTVDYDPLKYGDLIIDNCLKENGKNIGQKEFGELFDLSFEIIKNYFRFQERQVNIFNKGAVVLVNAVTLA